MRRIWPSIVLSSAPPELFYHWSTAVSFIAFCPPFFDNCFLAFVHGRITIYNTMAETLLLSLESATLNNTVGALFLGVLIAMLWVALSSPFPRTRLSGVDIDDDSGYSLFAITTLQTYWYYFLYPKDSQLHKFSVSQIGITCLVPWNPNRVPYTGCSPMVRIVQLSLQLQFDDVCRILDALQLALTIQAVYTYIVTGFGDRIESISWYVPRVLSCSSA